MHHLQRPGALRPAGLPYTAPAGGDSSPAQHRQSAWRACRHRRYSWAGTAIRWCEPGPWCPRAMPRLLPTLGMDIGEIIASRSSLVRSESKIVIKEAEAPGKLLEACQQIAMSSAPVGTEVSFFKPPQGRLQFDGVLSPSGPSGELKEMQITTNPLIPRKVDQMVEDRDASAAAALGELYSSGIGMDHISRMLSLGLLGKKRKLVPTRWSITASDDMIGKAAEGGGFGQAAGERLLSLFRRRSGKPLRDPALAAALQLRAGGDLDAPIRLGGGGLHRRGHGRMRSPKRITALWPAATTQPAWRSWSTWPGRDDRLPCWRCGRSRKPTGHPWASGWCGRWPARP